MKSGKEKEDASGPGPKFFIKNVMIEVLEETAKGVGEGAFAPKDSPHPCWTTSTTCFCTCGGCTSLTHDGPALEKSTISRYRDLEAKLNEALSEVKTRRSFLEASSKRR